MEATDKRVWTTAICNGDVTLKIEAAEGAMVLNFNGLYYPLTKNEALDLAQSLVLAADYMKGQTQ